jgi:UDP-N-acetylmuramoylalanine--D-glutamate ligase
MHSFQSKRVVVMGLGQFGGGAGVARFLCEQGARVLVTDQSTPEQLADSVKAISDLPVELRLGEHREADFAEADLIVVNPAVKPHGNKYIAAARNAGVPLTSEIRLLVERLPDRQRVVGITGSAGKSTTTAMVGHLLEHTGQRAWVGGNLGGSLLPQLPHIAADDWVILELSSFMLEGLGVDRWSPHIAVITNLSPNHLDWHGTFDEYAAAKAHIVGHQQRDDVAILGPGVAPLIAQPASRVVDMPPVEGNEIKLLIPGTHNVQNAMTALAIAQHMGIAEGDAREALRSFAGLRHRLQFVCEHNEVRYFNDSKSTTPDAAIMALRSFPAGKVHAILGGYDKGSNLTPLAKFAAEHCHAIYTIGQTGDTIAHAAANEATVITLMNDTGAPRPSTCGGVAGWTHPPAQIVRSGTLDQALLDMATRVRRGDIVLLSPGCASWDQFRHFEVRGSAFVEAILKYQGEDAPPPRA